MKDYGISLAVNTIQRLRTEADIHGFHFCTLNLEKSVQRVLETLGWVGGAALNQNKLIVVSALPPDCSIIPHNVFACKDAPSTPSLSFNDADPGLVITSHNASNSATLGLSTLSTEGGEAGRGELNNAASWDDFPNGRFGDFKSPAFGNQDIWGGSGISVRFQ